MIFNLQFYAQARYKQSVQRINYFETWKISKNLSPKQVPFSRKLLDELHHQNKGLYVEKGKLEIQEIEDLQRKGVRVFPGIE